MSGETSITVIGNLTTDPELRFTPSGSAVANFTIASTPRSFDRQKNEWVDGETLFLRASVWREAAENVAESLTKGMRVIASGLLKSRTFETKTGEKRTVIELDVEDIGPSLRYAAIPSGFTKSEESPGANPGPEHAVTGGAHPADEFTISPRQYSDVDDAWFGTHTNPAGRIGAGTPDA